MDVMMSVTKPELSNPEKLARWQGGFQAKLIELTLQVKFKRMTVYPTCLVEIMFDQTADPAKLVLMETWAQIPAV
jgi:hypothetical protein